MNASVSVLAGSVSTAIFVASTLPMLMKAGRTKDLASYSLGNIVLANLGNLIYAIYVVSLPLGPVWALHGFHLGATGLMLFWYLRHAGRERQERKPHRHVDAQLLPSTAVDHSLHSATSPNSR